MDNYSPNLLGIMYFENPNSPFEVGDSILGVVTQLLDGGEDVANGLI